MNAEKWECVSCNAENHISTEVCSSCRKSCYEIDDEQYMLNLIAPPENRRPDGSNIIPYRKRNNALEAATSAPFLVIALIMSIFSNPPANLGLNKETVFYAIDVVIPAILAAIGSILLCINCWSVVIDHIDRRKNEVKYYDFQQKLLIPGASFLAIALLIKIITSEFS